MMIKIALISSPVSAYSKLQDIIAWRDKMQAAAKAEPDVVGYQVELRKVEGWIRDHDQSNP